MNKPRRETGLRRITAMLAVFAGVVVVYDIWCLLSGHAKEGLYILPFGLAAFVAITAKIISHLESCPDHPQDGPHRDSCLHPDNVPKGRRDAPDGTSD